MNLFDFEFYAPVYLGIFVNLIVMFLLAYQGIIAFSIHRKTDFDYAKPLLYLCIASICYSSSLVYAYFGIFSDYKYELSHAAIFLGIFTNTIYLNTLRKYTKAPPIFIYYEYLFIGFSFLSLVVFWQSILFTDDTLIYVYGYSPSVPYVSLVAQYNGVGNLFCSIFLSLIGVVGAIFSIHILHHVWQTSQDKWIICGVILNLFLGLHDVAWMLHFLFYAFPLISLSFVVEIMRMTFQMQSSSARRADKLEDEVNYLTQVSRAGFAVGQICHDIRNPLAVIEGHHKRIARSLENFDKSQESIMRSNNKIAASSRRIGVILDNYLGEIYHASDPKYEEISLKKVLEESIELCSEKAKSSGVSKITCECSELDFVYGVENQLVMAFVNLLSNSCDAIEGLEERWISVKSLRDGSAKLIIRVVDSGLGISRQLESNIFERSFTTKEKGKGTGLGLSFVKKVIEAHKGSIYVDHEVRHTCFVITLPNRNTGVINQKMAV